jgi:hypothetical protein
MLKDGTHEKADSGRGSGVRIEGKRCVVGRLALCPGRSVADFQLSEPGSAVRLPFLYLPHMPSSQPPHSRLLAAHVCLSLLDDKKVQSAPISSVDDRQGCHVFAHVEKVSDP